MYTCHRAGAQRLAKAVDETAVGDDRMARVGAHGCHLQLGFDNVKGVR
jgi:hypothetical protein